MKIGFIGLGKMGKHMALNMLKCGDESIVSDIRSDSFAEFKKKGAIATTNIKEVAKAEIIFLSLPDSSVVKNVVLGKDGIYDYLRKGQIVIDLSTITYNSTLEIVRGLKELGVEFIDAPVSGMETRAAEGTLTVMCGGNEEVFNKIKHYLEYIGDNILYMGDSGSGQLAKLINQLLFDINAAALAEILPMAVKMGLDQKRLVGGQ